MQTSDLTHRSKLHVATSRLNVRDIVWLQYVALAIIVFLAGALRFYKLGAWSFWIDEMLTVQNVADGFNNTWLQRSLSLTLIQVSIATFGVSEWSARLVPALIGLITIPVLYVPVKRIFGPAVALVASLLLAIAPWHLYWSQNARFYPLLLLFYTLALLTFYIGLEEDRPVYLVASLLLLGLAARERLLALFFVPIVVSYVGLLYVLPFEKPAGLRSRTLGIFILPGLALLLLFAGPYLRHINLWLSGFSRVNNNPFWLVAGVIYYVRLSTVCMAAAGAVFLLMHKHRAALLLALGAVLPLVAIVAVSPFHYTANRYVFVSLTSWIILAAVAAVHLLRQSDRGVQILAVGVVLFLILDPIGEDVLYYKYNNGNRDDWKAAFTYVARQKADDALVVSPNKLLATYYVGEPTTAMGQVDLCQIERGDQTVWFVEDMTVGKVFPDVQRWLHRRATLVATFDVQVQARNFIMRVYRYDPSEARALSSACSSEVK